MTSEPARHADAAAEAIRALNHATLPGRELSEPADVYTTLSALASLAGRLPQALAQLHAFLELEAEAGRLRVVDGEYAGDVTAAIIATRTALAVAAAGADTLASGLTDAHNAVAWIAIAEPVATPIRPPASDRHDDHPGVQRR